MGELPVDIFGQILGALGVQGVDEDVEVVGAKEDAILVLEVARSRQGQSVHFRFRALRSRRRKSPVFCGSVIQ